MTQHIEDIDRGWNRIMRTAKKMERNQVAVDVGIIEGEAKEIHADSDLTNADVGFFHEFGTEDIWERSFIRALIDERRRDISRLFERISKGMIDGKVSQRIGLGLAGQQVVSWIKARIRAHIPPPLTPSTIERKGSSTPLIDTSQLEGSLTHAVRGLGEGEK
jgi:hypothetical protein